MDGSSELVSRINPNDKDNVKNQIISISKKLKELKQNEIVLSDDIVFSGNVLRTIKDLFSQEEIDVVGISAAISTIGSFNRFSEELKYGITSGVLLDDYIDQVCERDFYFGVPQSGISIKKNDNIVYKAPYFKPYGDAVERSSIPQNEEIYFSKGCLERSIALWNEIEQLSNKEVLIKDLPEKIINTEDEKSVVKTLRKEFKRL